MRTSKAKAAGAERADAVIDRIERLVPIAIELELFDSDVTAYGSLLDEMMMRASGVVPPAIEHPSSIFPEALATHFITALRYGFMASFLFKERKKLAGFDSFAFLARQVGLSKEEREERDGLALLARAEAAASFAEGYVAAVLDYRAVMKMRSDLAAAAKKRNKAKQEATIVAEATKHGVLDAKARASIGRAPGVGIQEDTVRKTLAAVRKRKEPPTS